MSRQGGKYVVVRLLRAIRDNERSLGRGTGGMAAGSGQTAWRFPELGTASIL